MTESPEDERARILKANELFEKMIDGLYQEATKIKRRNEVSQRVLNIRFGNDKV